MLQEISSCCKFPVVYVRQKSRELVGSRQCYCNNDDGTVFWTTVYKQRHFFLTKSSIWFISVLFIDECCSSRAASSWFRLCITHKTIKDIKPSERDLQQKQQK